MFSEYKKVKNPIYFSKNNWNVQNTRIGSEMRMRVAAVVLAASCWCACALEWPVRERAGSGVKVGTAATARSNTTSGRGSGVRLGGARAQRTTTPQPLSPYAPYPPYLVTPTDANIDKEDVYEEETVSIDFYDTIGFICFRFFLWLYNIVVYVEYLRLRNDWIIDVRISWNAFWEMGILWVRSH